MTGHDVYRSPRRGAPRTTTTIPVTVYGRQWCGISQMVAGVLDRIGMPYDLRRPRSRPGRRVSPLVAHRRAECARPMVQIRDEMLVQPSVQEVARALARRGAR